MSKLNYVDWDVLDTGGHYEFSPQEMIDIDYLNLTNFLLRGEGAVYTFNCDPSIPKGTTITVRNNEFGLDEGYYFGIQIILNPEQSIKRSSYWFFFENQVESFTFNGVFWKCNSTEPKAIPQMSFIDNKTIASGYVDIEDYSDELKKVLFSNIDMKNFDPSILISSYNDKEYGTFFRPAVDDSMGILEKGGLKSHNHTTHEHGHNFPHNNYTFPSQKADTTGKKFKYTTVLPNTPDGNGNYPSSTRSSEEGVTIKNSGTKTIPINISGRYVIKCF